MSKEYLVKLTAEEIREILYWYRQTEREGWETNGLYWKLKEYLENKGENPPDLKYRGGNDYQCPVCFQMFRLTGGQRES